MATVQQPDVVGPFALSLAPGTATTVIASKKTPLDLDAYLVYYGNQIDVNTNQNFATFRIRINGSPLPPFDNLTSQFGQLTLPTRLPAPQLITRGALVELTGEMGAGAVGNTVMAAVAGLVYVTPGQLPS